MERKNKKKTISLTCSKCGKVFEKEFKEYKRRTEKSTHCKFYCSRKCGLGGKADDYSPFRTFLYLSRKHAKSRGIHFSIDLKYIKKLWETQKGKCFYTSIPMLLFANKNKTEFKPEAASLDRIDTSQGYIRGNIRFVCMSINYAKNRFEEKDFVGFLEKVRRWSSSHNSYSML